MDNQKTYAVFSKDITKNRKAYDLIDCSPIAVQEHGKVLIDLEKVYFRYRGVIFKITTQSIATTNQIDLLMTRLLGTPVYQAEISHANANAAVREINNFFGGQPSSKAYNLLLDGVRDNNGRLSVFFQRLARCTWSEDCKCVEEIQFYDNCLICNGTTVLLDVAVIMNNMID